MDLERLARLQESFTTLTGLGLVYRNASDRGVGNLPSHLNTHHHSFCRQTKELGLFPGCYQDCVSIAYRRARKTRTPFVKKCHVGVRELVAPVYGDGRFLGLFFVGPFRFEEDTPPSDIVLAPQFLSVPLATPHKIRASRDLVSAIVDALVREEPSQRDASDEKQVSPDPVATAVQFVESNFYRPITGRDAAKMCSLSLSRFSHLFAETVGSSFVEYVRATRLEAAKQMLKHSPLTVAGVAAECGYNSPSRFHEVFREKTGMTPRAFGRKFGTGKGEWV